MLLALWFMSTIAAGAFHQHLHAQEVTTQEPPAATAQNPQASAESTSPGQQENLPEAPEPEGIPQAVPFVPRPAVEDRVVLESDTQSKHGDVYLLSGDVEITYRGHVLHADSISYDKATGEVIADGHVRLTGGENDESLQASRGTYNLRTETGRFYDVKGSVGLRALNGGTPSPTTPGTVQTASNPLLFSGRMVVKTGPENYDIYNGWVTSCQLPRPDWEFTAAHLWTRDGTAYAKNSTFRLLHIPILFLPYASHPVDVQQRQSGLLIPVVSQSTTKGFIFGDQVYFVLGRSADATAGVDYFSKRGFSEMGTVRYRGRGNDFINGHFSALQDRGFLDNFGHLINQGGEDITASFRRDFTPKLRAVGDAEYLSSYVYREAFNDNFNQAVSSDITSIAYLAHQSNGFELTGRFDRYQGLKRVPYVDAAGDQIAGEDVRIFHAPSLDVTALDHYLPGTPFLWDLTGSVAGLKRVQPNFQTSGLVAREDLRPELSLPLSGDGWHALASVAVRETFYAKSRQAPYGPAAVPVQLNQSVTRTSVETKVDVRPPAIERTFEVPARWQKWFGSEVRHTIEPEVTYSYTTGINNFFSILRFDEDDLDSNTNELEYGVTQHLFFRPRAAKPTPCSAVQPIASQTGSAEPENSEPESILPEAASTDANGIPSVSATAPDEPLRAQPKKQPACQPGKTLPRQTEWFSWRLAQRHFFDPTFGGAVINGRRNVFTSTLSLSGIAFLTEPRDISPLISRMRFRTSSHTDLEWDFDLDTGAKRLTSSNVFFNAHEGPWFGGISYAALNAPGRFYSEVIDTTNNTQTLKVSANSDFSQMRLLLGYGAPNKPGLSAAANVGLDLGNTALQYGSLQASYNWNCCGLSVEYRKYELGSVRNEGVERFSFTLINIGTAGNIRRSERLF